MNNILDYDYIYVIKKSSYLIYSSTIKKTMSQSYQTFFFVKQRFFSCFALKLGHFKAWTIFSCATSTQLNNKNMKKQRNQSL